MKTEEDKRDPEKKKGSKKKDKNICDGGCLDEHGAKLSEETISSEKPKKEKKVTKASELFEKFEKGRDKKCTFTGYEFAVLSDLQIYDGRLDPGTHRHTDIINEYVDLRDNRAVEVAKIPEIWSVKIKTVREKRFDSTMEFGEISCPPQSYPSTSYATHGVLPSDPETAGALFRVLKIMGDYRLCDEAKVILRSASVAELNVFMQILKETPPIILKEKQAEFFHGIKEALIGAGAGVESFEQLLAVARANRANDPDRTPASKRIPLAALPGISVFGVSQAAAYIAGLTILPVGLGAIAAAGLVGAGWVYWRTSGKKHPHIVVLEDLTRKEKFGQAGIDRYIPTDHSLPPVANGRREVAEENAEKQSLDGERQVQKGVKLFAGSQLEEPLRVLNEERENLERTLNLAGYKELPPTLKRSFEILEEMLEKYSDVLQTGGEPTQAASEKIISTSKSMQKYITELNTRLKAAFEREISGHAMAVKSILSSLEQIEQEMSHLVN